VLEYDKETLTNNLGSGSVSGWVKMSEMVADYDNDAFESDHWSEFVMESAPLELAEDSTAYGYKYPGSGIVVDEFSGGLFQGIQLSPLFTDPAGRQWGFVGYYYGRHDCWICMDDPTNDALAPDENCVTVVTVAPPTPTAAPDPTDVPVPTAAPTPAPPAPTEEPVPEPIPESPEPTAEPTEAPVETPTQSTVPEETPAPAPAPTPVPGKTVELTPPADKETLDQAAKDNRGAGPYIAAGAAAVVVIAAAVLVATLKKKK